MTCDQKNEYGMWFGLGKVDDLAFTMKAKLWCENVSGTGGKDVRIREKKT